MGLEALPKLVPKIHLEHWSHIFAGGGNMLAGSPTQASQNSEVVRELD